MPDEAPTQESQEPQSDAEEPENDSQVTEPEEPEQEDPTAVLTERLAELNNQVLALMIDRDEARAAAVEARAAAEQATSRILDLSPQVLAATRRALLAENPEAVPELIAGDTVDALEASVTAARDTYARIRSQLQAEAASQVPTGASPGAPVNLEDLTPMQKLTQALSRNNRG